MITAMTGGNEGASATALLAGNIVALVFEVCIFVSVIHGDVWLQGDRDRNSVNFGHMKEDRLRGLKLGLLASIPAAVSYILLVVEKLTGFFSLYTLIYRVGHISFYPVLVWAFGADISVTTAQISWGGIALAVIPVLVLPVVTMISYLLGYAQISLGERLVYENKNKGKKKK